MNGSFALYFVFIQWRKVNGHDSWILKQSLIYSLKNAASMRNWQSKYHLLLNDQSGKFWWKKSLNFKGPNKDKWQAPKPIVSRGDSLWGQAVSLHSHRQVSLCIFSMESILILHLVSRLCFRFSVSMLVLLNKDTRVCGSPVSAGNWDSKALGAAPHVHMLL